MAIQMNVSGLRRNLKNIAHNYTDAQVKVREATSNDPWGPSSTLMSEIADLTYNVVAFSEIMQMIWKRLNDHGRNWRHVYKALVLLEYLIKTGSEKIAEQCKENIFAIQTLKDFQYLEENKDMGINVREKAKSLVALLRDDERLRNERVRALKAKERFAQSVSAIGSDSDINSPSSPSYPDTFVTSSLRHERQTYGVAERSIPASELENARPQTVGEEELQLQLALAMSKEEADQEEAKRKSDDVRLQMALSESEADYQSPQRETAPISESRDRFRGEKDDKSALKDLLDINFNPNGVVAASSSMSTLPSNSSVALDPWGVPLTSTAPSSGSMSPQNVVVAAAPSIQPPKTSLLDVFQDSDDLIQKSASASELNIIDSLADPWGMPIVNRETGGGTPKQNDPWSSPASAPPSRVTSPPTTNDPWAPVALSKSPEPPVLDDPWTPKPSNDPWSSVSSSGTTPQPPVDPFAPIVSENADDFSAISTRDQTKSDSDEAFDFGDLRRDLTLCSENGFSKSKSPTAFLGENSGLVNLDNLVSVRPAPVGMGGTSSPSYQNMNSLSSHLNNNINHSNGSTFATELDFGTISQVANANNHQQQPQLIHNTTTITPPITTMNHNTNNNHHNNPFLSQSTTQHAPLAPSLVAGVNPFSGPSPPNPFQVQQAPKPSLNEMRTQGGPIAAQNSPWGPSPPPPATNNLNRDDSPFMI